MSAHLAETSYKFLTLEPEISRSTALRTFPGKLVRVTTLENLTQKRLDEGCHRLAHYGGRSPGPYLFILHLAFTSPEARQDYAPSLQL